MELAELEPATSWVRLRIRCIRWRTLRLLKRDEATSFRSPSLSLVARSVEPRRPTNRPSGVRRKRVTRRRRLRRR
jgi:hypothetical protein